VLRRTRRSAVWSLVVLRYRFASWVRQARGRDASVDSAGPDAVVFSSYVPTDEALAVAHEFLDVFKEGFSDCDFFVGINPGSLPQWELALRESGLRMRIGKVDPRLAVDSDASGFQRALQLMRDERRAYRLVWFGHTKGTTANNPPVRRYLIENFYLERRRIANFFVHPRVGSFGNDVTLDVNLGEIDARMNRLFPFPYEGIGTFYLHTFYVLRGSIVGSFLGGCSEDFFTKNLVRDLGFDRYFFERDFSRLADRFGYYPLYRVRHQHMSTVPVTRPVLRSLYGEWEQQLPTSMRATIHFS
jgi:hypothetical protein